MSCGPRVSRSEVYLGYWEVRLYHLNYCSFSSYLRCRTLEYLVSSVDEFAVCRHIERSSQETLGVPVVSYAKTEDFPAFYSRRSGFKVNFYGLHLHLD